MSDTIYMGGDQRERHPAVGAAFDALGQLLAKEARRHGDAGRYAEIVKRLLVIVGAPSVKVSKDPHYGGNNYAVSHPDRRVEEAFYYVCEHQLRELGLVAPTEAPAYPGGERVGKAKPAPSQPERAAEGG